MNADKKRRRKSKIMWGIATTCAVLWTLITVFPFGFMIMNSLKGQEDLLKYGVVSFPKSLNIQNYLIVFQRHFMRYFTNSVIVLVVSLTVLLFVSACAAYPLSRFQFRLNKTMFYVMVVCMAIPIHVTLIPVFRISKVIGVYDSIWAMVGPYVGVGLPVSVFMLVGFMRDIPKEIEEAALIDGCNRYSMFFRMILPLSRHGLATAAIYNGVGIWNEFSYAYTLTQSPKSRTLPLAIWQFQGMYVMNMPIVMASLTLTVLPMLLLFHVTRTMMVSDIICGTVKR